MKLAESRQILRVCFLPGVNGKDDFNPKDCR